MDVVRIRMREKKTCRAKPRLFYRAFHTHVFARVNGVLHDGDPALEGGHLEQGQVGVAHVVKVDGRVDPLGPVLLQAGRHVGGDLGTHRQQRRHVPTLGR